MIYDTRNRLKEKINDIYETCILHKKNHTCSVCLNKQTNVTDLVVVGRDDILDAFEIVMNNLSLKEKIEFVPLSSAGYTNIGTSRVITCSSFINDIHVLSDLNEKIDMLEKTKRKLDDGLYRCSDPYGFGCILCQFFTDQTETRGVITMDRTHFVQVANGILEGRDGLEKDVNELREVLIQKKCPEGNMFYHNGKDLPIVVCTEFISRLYNYYRDYWELGEESKNDSDDKKIEIGDILRDIHICRHCDSCNEECRHKDSGNISDGRKFPYRMLGMVVSQYLARGYSMPRFYEMVLFDVIRGVTTGFIDDLNSKEPEMNIVCVDLVKEILEYNAELKKKEAEKD